MAAPGVSPLDGDCHPVAVLSATFSPVSTQKYSIAAAGTNLVLCFPSAIWVQGSELQLYFCIGITVQELLLVPAAELFLPIQQVPHPYFH